MLCYQEVKSQGVNSLGNLWCDSVHNFWHNANRALVTTVFQSSLPNIK